MDFAAWLRAEIDRNGWTESQFARQAGNITASAVNQYLNHGKQPGLNLCRAAAIAFKMPLEDVFRMAGILPPKTIPPELRVNQRPVVYTIDTEEFGRRIMALWRSLEPEDQILIVNLIERLAGAQPVIIGEAVE